MEQTQTTLTPPSQWGCWIPCRGQECFFPTCREKKKCSISSLKPTPFLVIVQRKLPKHELSQLNLISAKPVSVRENWYTSSQLWVILTLKPNYLILMSIFFTASLLFMPAKSMAGQDLSMTPGYCSWQQVNGYRGGFLNLHGVVWISVLQFSSCVQQHLIVKWPRIFSCVLLKVCLSHGSSVMQAYAPWGNLLHVKETRAAENNWNIMLL